MFRKWAGLSALAILAAFAISSTSCRTIEYRPADEQVFILPPGTVLTAPEGACIETDGPDGKVELKETRIGYRGVLLSDGYFLKLYRERREGRAEGEK